ncbi:hypothetical protein HDU76_009109 [Blyttiomyces sp. JEL0837]|nr:hypothetical protein HDU76_009109 [Blyttiomyces sp. JEL0837]
MTKSTVKVATYPVEGAGSETFKNIHLIGALLGVPLVLTFLLGTSLVWYPFLAILTALPTFAGFNVLYVAMVPPIRPQKGLPNKNIEEYLLIKDAVLKQTYHGKNKIPAETWFEAYFDQKIDLVGGDSTDLLELLEVRHDWMAFKFTFEQAKFFVTQWIPELLWHSRKQDEDQVRDHYDRGDDFYNWFCEYRVF